MLSHEDVQNIRRFVYRNARPLDLQRWQYHFEFALPEQVSQVLSAYQNPDGGFGHALEADSWNPNSSPIQTGTAATILLETGFAEKNHPLIFGILRYLDSGADMEDDRWLSVIPSNDDYPHAPWWESGSESSSHSMYNPTAILAGFALCFSPRISLLFSRCKRIAQELISSFLSDPDISMHPLLCVQTLLDFVKKAKLTDLFDTEELEENVLDRASELILADKDKWSGYACRPSEFIRTPQHPLYEEMKGFVSKELDWLEETRNSEGVWDITWGWNGYEKAFSISENWWKADVAIRNTRFLRAFGRLKQKEDEE